MKFTFLHLLLALCFRPVCQSIDLFNGENIDGWEVDVPDLDEDPDGTIPFVVRNGNIISLGTPQGHLITNENFEDFQLKIKYRFTGEPGNCGVLVHASERRQLYDMFPKSIEVQMMHENAGDFWCIVADIKVPNMVERRGPKEEWGIVEGRKRRILNLTDGSENALGDWNEMVVECLGDEIKVWVNGDFVNYGFESTVQSGQIAIQAEGSEVEFESIRIQPIQELSDSNQ